MPISATRHLLLATVAIHRSRPPLQKHMTQRLVLHVCPPTCTIDSWKPEIWSFAPAKCGRKLLKQLAEMMLKMATLSFDPRTRDSSSSMGGRNGLQAIPPHGPEHLPDILLTIVMCARAMDQCFQPTSPLSPLHVLNDPKAGRLPKQRASPCLHSHLFVKEAHAAPARKAQVLSA